MRPVLGAGVSPHLAHMGIDRVCRWQQTEIACLWDGRTSGTRGGLLVLRGPWWGDLVESPPSGLTGGRAWESSARLNCHSCTSGAGGTRGGQQLARPAPAPPPQALGPLTHPQPQTRAPLVSRLCCPCMGASPRLTLTLKATSIVPMVGEGPGFLPVQSVFLSY